MGFITEYSLHLVERLLDFNRIVGNMNNVCCEHVSRKFIGVFRPTFGDRNAKINNNKVTFCSDDRQTEKLRSTIKNGSIISMGVVLRSSMLLV